MHDKLKMEVILIKLFLMYSIMIKLRMELPYKTHTNQSGCALIAPEPLMKIL